MPKKKYKKYGSIMEAALLMDDDEKLDLGTMESDKEVEPEEELEASSGGTNDC